MVPYMTFLVAFSNYIFQIAVPTLDKDAHIMGKTIDFFPFPNIFEGVSQYGRVSYRRVNLSSKEKVYGEQVKMVQHADKIIPAKIENIKDVK